MLFYTFQPRMNKLQQLQDILQKPSIFIGKVVDFDSNEDRLMPFNLTAENTELTPALLGDTTKFTHWVEEQLTANNARYGIGGYNEHRTIYSRSAHFDTKEEPRRLHLGTDIWGPALTPIYNFYEGKVHSFNFNNNFGDYGATIILEYQLPDLKLYALYGHLNLASLKNLREGQLIAAGEHFASFGIQEENGFWPPHLHFQLMFDMQNWVGDYPGVCQFSKKEEYLANCPDPFLILSHTFASALLLIS